MPLELGPRSPLIRKWKDLKKSSVRAEHGLFLAEGTNAAREAHRSQWPLEAVCCTERWLDRHPTLAEGFALQTVTVTEAALGQLTDAESPDGIVLVCQSRERPGGKSSVHRFEGKRESLSPFLGVVATELQDPGNLGTLIRTTVATGGQPVVLGPGSVDPLHPKALRASAGLWFRSPAWRLGAEAALRDWLTHLKENGVKIFAAAASPAPEDSTVLPREGLPLNQSLWAFDFRGPTCFLVGNEARGLDPELMRLADALVFIPMEEEAESLNVGVAGSLLLYEARRQRQFNSSAT